ncbi:MAG: hypothetical protein NTZ59_07510 [Bacteroidetes bacterium]|jgi:hypothetical protein|nr:hypothetical protein [Bacteroidota bacterium]
MYTTYHLNSAQEINNDFLEAIKHTYKSKAITIIVEEDEEVTDEMKSVLKQRLNEDEESYITAQDSINHLNKKYGL